MKDTHVGGLKDRRWKKDVKRSVNKKRGELGILGRNGSARGGRKDMRGKGHWRKGEKRNWTQKDKMVQLEDGGKKEEKRRKSWYKNGEELR